MNKKMTRPGSIFMTIYLLSAALLLPGCSRDPEENMILALLLFAFHPTVAPVEPDNSALEVNGLLWQRCTIGQTFRSGIGDCHGAGTVLDDFGAIPLNFCSYDTDECNDTGGDLLLVTGQNPSSEIYNACADLDLAGHTDWRVPTVDELFAIVECPLGSADETSGCYVSDGPTIDLSIFPDTIIGDYWSANASSTLRANSISFRRGQRDDSPYKTFKKYLRCVRDL